MKRLIAFLLFTGLCLQGDRAHGERPIPPEDIDRTFNVDYESQPIPVIREISSAGIKFLSVSEEYKKDQDGWKDGR